jgi:hypothetical protein
MQCRTDHPDLPSAFDFPHRYNQLPSDYWRRFVQQGRRSLSEECIQPPVRSIRFMDPNQQLTRPTVSVRTSTTLVGMALARSMYEAASGTSTVATPPITKMVMAG